MRLSLLVVFSVSCIPSFDPLPPCLSDGECPSGERCEQGACTPDVDFDAGSGDGAVPDGGNPDAGDGGLPPGCPLTINGDTVELFCLLEGSGGVSAGRSGSRVEGIQTWAPGGGVSLAQGSELAIKNAPLLDLGLGFTIDMQVTVHSFPGSSEPPALLFTRDVIENNQCRGESWLAIGVETDGRVYCEFGPHATPSRVRSTDPLVLDRETLISCHRDLFNGEVSLRFDGTDVSGGREGPPTFPAFGFDAPIFLGWSGPTCDRGQPANATLHALRFDDTELFCNPPGGQQELVAFYCLGAGDGNFVQDALGAAPALNVNGAVVLKDDGILVHPGATPSIPSDPNADIPDGFSIELEISVAPGSTRDQVLFSRAAFCDSDVWLKMSLDASNRLVCSSGASGDPFTRRSIDTVPVGARQRVECEVIGGGEINLFINGVDNGSAIVSGLPEAIGGFGQPFLLGRDACPDPPFDGIFHNLAVRSFGGEFCEPPAGPVNWEMVIAGPVPPPRSGASMATHVRDQAAIMFGGDPMDTGGWHQDTWRFDGGAWEPLFPAMNPTPRRYAAMAYDLWNERIILHGGEDENDNILSDTWILDDNGWFNVQAPPLLRARHTIAFDFATGLVLYGGTEDGIVPNGETYLWDETQERWNLVTAAAGHPRELHTMATFDDIILYGGMVGGTPPPPSNSTWRFQGGVWTDVANAGPPGFGGKMAFHPGLGHLVYFNGGMPGGPPPMLETWGFAGNWFMMPVAMNPPPRLDAAMAEVGCEVVMFGGHDPGMSTTLNDTWVLK